MTKKSKPPSTKRITWTTQFKRDVKHFHTVTGMEYTVIGIRAIKNPRFYERLLSGGTITLASADKVYDFMEDQGYFFNRTNKENYGQVIGVSCSPDRALQGSNHDGQTSK